MAISRKPERKASPSATREKDILAFINQGGSSAKGEDNGSEELKRVQLRLYSSKLSEIDRAIEDLKVSRKRKPTFSRHQWLEEAIEEKLKRAK